MKKITIILLICIFINLSYTGVSAKTETTPVETKTSVKAGTFVKTGTPVKTGSVPVKNPGDPVKSPVQTVDVKNIEKLTDNNKSIEKIIKFVKQKMEIPKEYTAFTSVENQYYNIPSIHLRWASERGFEKNGGSFEFEVDKMGNILSFYHYKYSDNYNIQKRIPKITPQQAFDLAKKFVYHIRPDITSQISFEAGLENYWIEGGYRFYFHRVINNLPFYENGVSVLVNSDSGEIMNFSCSWLDKRDFPVPSKGMKLVDAQAAYKKNFEIALKYRKVDGEPDREGYFEYSTVVEAPNFLIDAISGGKLFDNGDRLYGNPYFYLFPIYNFHGEKERTEYGFIGASSEEVQNTKGIVSVESAEKLIRSIQSIGIGTEYALNNYIYTKNDEKLFLDLEFVKKAVKKPEAKGVPAEKQNQMEVKLSNGNKIDIQLDAQTSEILSVQTRYLESQGIVKGTKSKKVDLKKTAEAFLKKYKADKFNQLVPAVEQAVMRELSKDFMGPQDADSVFVYVRKQNGIVITEDKVIMVLDPNTGMILRYDESWSDIRNLSAQGVLGVNQAWESLFKENGFEYRYIMLGDIVHLAYGPNCKKTVSVDAFTGSLINQMNGRPFITKGQSRYKDIGSHAAKDQILALEQIGVSPDEEKFRPDEPILQKEILAMILMIKDIYPTSSNTGYPKQKKLDSLYRLAMNEELIDEVEKSPDRKVTKEDAIKYLLRFSGYKKFAELEGVFHCDFEDREEISPGLIGYACIAKAVDLVKGKQFTPKKELTRAEAAGLIYNLLKR